jgi:alcohol dehydrogenase class IV
MIGEFATAGRIVFGQGAAARVESTARALGSRTFLVTGATPRVEASAAATLAVDGEPTVDLVRAGVESAREAGCNVVVSAGGGSAIDAGKAIAALLANPGDPLDYLEVVGRGVLRFDLAGPGLVDVQVQAHRVLEAADEAHARIGLLGLRVFRHGGSPLKRVGWTCY